MMEQARITFDKLSNPGFDDLILAPLHAPLTQRADYQCAQGLNDHITHAINSSRWVAERAFLHVGADNLAHSELKNLPYREYI